MSKKNEIATANISQSVLVIADSDYRGWLSDLHARYKRLQIKASLAVNSAMLEFYWSIGGDISCRMWENKYGSKFYETLSRDMSAAIPELDGISATSLKYCRYFYELYIQHGVNRPQLADESGSEKNRPQLADDFRKPDGYLMDESVFQIPWGHHRTIIDKAKGDRNKALFYVHKTIQEGWSRAMLMNMIGGKDKAGLYEAQGQAVNNFAQTLPDVDSGLANDLARDPHNFGFLGVGEYKNELELQHALENHIVDLLLRLGNGFAFVGRQVRFQVAGDGFKCDLLFYHLRVRRYIVVELKVVKFEPEHAMQLAFYCNSVNHLLKGPHDNDTIGLVICKEKNDVVAQWTLECLNQDIPIGISTYEFDALHPVSKELKVNLSHWGGKVIENTNQNEK